MLRHFYAPAFLCSGIFMLPGIFMLQASNIEKSTVPTGAGGATKTYTAAEKFACSNKAILNGEACQIEMP